MNGKLWFEEASNNVTHEISEVLQLYEGSSVWCTGSNKSERICKFRNLCYHPIYQEYVFFHSNKTVMIGLPNDRFEPALLDMSSVDDHNTQYFNFVDLPANSLDSFNNVTFYDGLSYIFHRFNCDNIMHVFHDDLLPLFHTMKQFNHGNYVVDLDHRIVFMEGWNPGPYFDLYKLFSNKPPLLKQDLTRNDSLKCFQHAIVGISKTTTWYQYGFKTPQGPLPKTQVTSNEIKEFVAFVKQRLGVDVIARREPYIVMFLREYNRLVLNEESVSLAMSKEFVMKVVQVSLKTHTFIQLIEVISNASALVGMHGSALILTMFLPPTAVLVEMFPFAIKPDNYLPYKTLAEIPGMNLIYASWRNYFPENTVTHPNDAPEIGGIRHLSKEDQELIESNTEVAPHICCSNPFWLYRIYQDTIVDEVSFLNVVKEAFNRSRNMVMNDRTNKFYPSKVLDITCTPINDTVNPALFISWKLPINVKYFINASIKYEVWIQKSNENDYTAYILPFTQHVFGDGLESKTCYRIWIRCIAFDDMIGSFGSKECCTTT